jgi:3-deoxy-D-arabino-heptulosonate 7-phosphate (DAHP) synthase
VCRTFKELRKFDTLSTPATQPGRECMTHTLVDCAAVLFADDHVGWTAVGNRTTPSQRHAIRVRTGVSGTVTGVNLIERHSGNTDS